MITIIPMAGRGERFLKKGYNTPKPLIKIDSVPMVIKATRDLPPAERYIFICLDEHVRNFGIDKQIKEYISNAEIVSLGHVTEGQACTCMLALDNVRNNEEILIGACDNGMIFDRTLFNEMKKDCDALVFSFRNNITVVNKPQQYGWIDVDGEGYIRNMSVKIPLSNTPMNDHAVVGAFWFRDSSMFKKAVDNMISRNGRINNEFYVDECINDIIQLGYRARVFEIDHYICWGTPDDFETYNYWKTFFHSEKK